MGAEMKNNLLRVILECHEILTLLSSLSSRPVYLAQSSPYFLHKGKRSVDTAVTVQSGFTKLRLPPLSCVARDEIVGS